jgi:hypothetical protein
MRLTLRTLLAYLDDVLEPAEAQQLGEKIQESEFATKLVHRIRDCMRMDKLGAPRLSGRAAGLDANTVSEYLDNTLSAERVVDFEKYCLESDVHLAETACCHQILALVLGEPANVDPDARGRIYNLLAEHDAILRAGHDATLRAGHDATLRAGHDARGPGALAARSPSPEQTSPDKPSAASLNGSKGRSAELVQPAGKLADARLSRKAEVPDYLRTVSGGASAWWKVLAVVLVAVLLVCVVMMASGPLWHGSLNIQKSERAGSSIADVEKPLSVEKAKDDAKAATADSGDPIKVVDKDTSANKPAVKVEPREVNKPNNARVEVPFDPAKLLPELLPPPKESPENPLRSDAPPPPEPSKVAVLTSMESVLFRLDRKAGHWSRVPSLGALSPGDLLLCPPACKNALGLQGDLNVHLMGDTRLELLRSAPDQPPTLGVYYGRLLLMPNADPKSPLLLQAGDRPARVTFAKAGDALAVEVRLVRQPGTNPETTLSRYVVDLVALGNGSVVWEEAQAKPLSIAAPGRHTLGLAAGEPQPEGRPEWIERGEQLSSSEALAVKTLDDQLRGNAAKNLDEELAVEWAAYRQWEVRNMAHRWLISLDRFDAAVTALGNKERRESWPKIVEHLRLAVARDPKTAAAVRGAFEAARGDKAAGLYRMLWGYSEENLKAGDAKQLVDYLDHTDLDYRVLSWWCLTDITGKSFNVFYRPEQESALREAHVKRWRQMLEKGEIVPAKKKP